jgi:hypothetical protein
MIEAFITDESPGEMPGIALEEVAGFPTEWTSLV